MVQARGSGVLYSGDSLVGWLELRQHGPGVLGVLHAGGPLAEWLDPGRCESGSPRVLCARGVPLQVMWACGVLGSLVPVSP